MRNSNHISVVIPTYNGKHLLEKHLPHVAAILLPGDEIIVADDASTDDSEAWIHAQQPHYHALGIELKVVRHQQNKRFAATVNTGVAAAQHSLVFILNNDVSPLSKDTRSTLITWFADPLVFAVGVAEVTENTKDAQIFGRGTGGFQRGLSVHWYDKEQNLHNTLWAAGGSLMVDRQKYADIGGMDTLFAPAYEEDRDISYRALKHGWEVWFEPRVKVFHQHESTNTSVFGKHQMAVDSWKNQYLFVWKNITDWSYLFSHILWLPYHLTLSNWRSRGAAGQGFWKALRQLPAALKQRRTVAKLWQKTDHEVFSQAAIPVPSSSSPLTLAE